MKDPLNVAAVQFEMKEDDKQGNIKTMMGFVTQAANQGVDLICFPELCTTGYHYFTEMNKERLLSIGEDTRTGPTVKTFIDKAKAENIAIAFGVLEKDGDSLYNTYVVVTPEDGFCFQHRKVHAFENSAILQGHSLEVFELYGWTVGILICYDNNIPENTRVLALKGAEVILAPHQTGGFDIPRAGMGRIGLELWHNRKKDPEAIGKEIVGPKGREWIVKWLPSRAYDNNVYYVFSNGVGIDGPEVRTGNSMIIDPEGIIVAETTKADDDMIVRKLCKKVREGSLPSIHMKSRIPDLYGPICREREVRSTREMRNSISNETIV